MSPMRPSLRPRSMAFSSRCDARFLGRSQSADALYNMEGGRTAACHSLRGACACASSCSLCPRLPGSGRESGRSSVDPSEKKGDGNVNESEIDSYDERGMLTGRMTDVGRRDFGPFLGGWSGLGNGPY